MQPSELDAIRARVEAATPGQWIGEADSGRIFIWDDDLQNEIVEYVYTDEDHNFICNAPDDIRALLAEVERLNAALAGSRKIANRALSELHDELAIFNYRICPLCDGDEKHTDTCPYTIARAWK